jgi:hypothetical protein
MIYQVQCQYVPGLDTIWVARLSPQDPTYEYDNFAEASAKATELQDADTSLRQYRVAQL